MGPFMLILRPGEDFNVNNLIFNTKSPENQTKLIKITKKTNRKNSENV